MADRTKYVDVVMVALPGPRAEFVKLEDDQGRGMGPGSTPWSEWVTRDGGLYALRIWLEENDG